MNAIAIKTLREFQRARVRMSLLNQTSSLRRLQLFSSRSREPFRFKENSTSRELHALGTGI